MIAAWLKHRKSIKSAAAGLYQSAVAQSRCPRFYSELGVADTMDGRFDLICMHVFLILNRLEQDGKEGKYLSQALFDHMFTNMEYTLREIGVGDLSVPKHMKRMMKAFNGRVYSYHSALKNDDLEELEMAVVRNIYRMEGETAPSAARMMADYISRAAEHLLTQDCETLAAGRVCFPVISLPEKAYA